MPLQEIIELLRGIYHHKAQYLTPPELEALSIGIDHLILRLQEAKEHRYQKGEGA